MSNRQQQMAAETRLLSRGRLHQSQLPLFEQPWVRTKMAKFTCMGTLDTLPPALRVSQDSSCTRHPRSVSGAAKTSTHQSYSLTALSWRVKTR